MVSNMFVLTKSIYFIVIFLLPNAAVKQSFKPSFDSTGRLFFHFDRLNAVSISMIRVCANSPRKYYPMIYLLQGIFEIRQDVMAQQTKVNTAMTGIAAQTGSRGFA